MTRSAAAGVGVILEVRVEDEILDWDLKNQVRKKFNHRPFGGDPMERACESIRSVERAIKLNSNVLMVVARRSVVRWIKVLSAGLIIVTSVFSVNVAAQMKLTVVDVDRAIAGSEDAQKLLRQLQEEFRTDEDTIKKIQTEAAELLQKMQKDNEVMSDSEKRRMQQEIESLNNDFVYQRQKLQKEVAARQSELFAGTEDKVRKAIEELVLENDYDMILPRGAALYVGDLYDVTRKVTEKLNEMNSSQ